MKEWKEVRAWRRTTRGELLAKRLAIPRGERLFLRPIIGGMVATHFPELRHACVGFYWPFKGEIDLRHLMRDFMAQGAEAALPVVVEKGAPLEFWAWRPRMKLGRGIWNIPIPQTRAPLRPTALIVPLVGFDSEGYRLGYGGGYYDRTLAELEPRPLTIGVGYSCGRLDTIFPQPHDIPLDAIVTEAGLVRHGYRGRRRQTRRWGFSVPEVESYASPPCSMHELQPESLGYMSTGEIVRLLNELLEGERAGARAAAEMARSDADPRQLSALREVAMDEARFCAMLVRQVTRLGGAPSRSTGDFYDKVKALDSSHERLALLNRGQDCVVRRLRGALRSIPDPLLLPDLEDMLETHERNIARCEALGGAPRAT